MKSGIALVGSCLGWLIDGQALRLAFWRVRVNNMELHA